MLIRLVLVAGVTAIILGSSWMIARAQYGDPKNGQTLYQQHCLRCHGAKLDGNGPDGQYLVVPPANFQSLTSRSKTDWELLIAISQGVLFSPMHGWSGRLTDDQIRDVLSYIRMQAPFNPIS